MEYLISSVTIYFVYSFCIFIGGSELVNLVETVFMFFFSHDTEIMFQLHFKFAVRTLKSIMTA